jgi:hypothetical protein
LVAALYGIPISPVRCFNVNMIVLFVGIVLHY